MKTPDASFWKRKLAAYLHDNPSKCLDIPGHVQNAAAAFKRAGFSEEEVNRYVKASDWTAAAADRFPFPNSTASGLRCAFDGVRAKFRHPLHGEQQLSLEKEVRLEDALETETNLQNAWDHGKFPPDWDDAKSWRARFFAHWRLWQQHVTEKDWRMEWLPADTRLPDHTIWTHMQVVSALAACAESDDPTARIKPAFLKFQFGPVQEFIAAARSTRDLWSGSYLLSWLMAKGLYTLSTLVGPDAVIFPNLKGQPIFDLMGKEDLWEHLQIGEQSVWDSTLKGKTGWSKFLTPNLPNVFLAVVPEKHAEDLAWSVETSIRDEWRCIAEHCWKFVKDSKILKHDTTIDEEIRKKRFDHQNDRFLSISWHALPWPESREGVETLSKMLPEAGGVIMQRYQEVVKAATQTMKIEHRDQRYYTDREKKDQLNNIGAAWALLTSLSSWSLDAVRQTRTFEAWNAGGWESGTIQNKDALNGKEEAVAGGKHWKELTEKDISYWHHLFRHEDWVGSSTLIKRLWPFAYLEKVWGFKPRRYFPMPNTQQLAAGNLDDSSEGEVDKDDSQSGYFAIIAFDGDEIGKWVSGTHDKFPAFSTQLAAYKDGVGNEQGALPYFKKNLPCLLKSPRPLSPSYHLLFSQALSNFAVHCAGPIVEAYKGKLIYAGGDDVLAMVPADRAIPCATALRKAFRGEEVPEAGLETVQGTTGFLINQETKQRMLLPGPNFEASVGIAIAHAKNPLQDVVREAQQAEKRAKAATDKGGHGRAAFAITLCKHSGETIQWGGKWESAGHHLCKELIQAMREDLLSKRMPHALIRLLTPYQNQSSSHQDDDSFQADPILNREISHVLNQQRGERWDFKKANDLQSLLDDYTRQTSGGTQSKIRSLIGLCQTAAFISRQSPAKED